MSGEDQEQFEDYLELERYIEELQADQAAHPAADLTLERARIYRMAALFRSVSPEAAEPHPDFVASLHARLLLENEEADPFTMPVRPPAQPQKPARKNQQEAPLINRPRRAAAQKGRSFSRRSLLGGSAAAAASLVVGAGIGAAFENKEASNANAKEDSNTPMVPSAVSVPYLVTSLAELGNSAVRFSTDTLVGYIIRSDGPNGEPAQGDVIAVSASCTHMGCIIQWQDSDRSFHCPCHGGVYNQNGQPSTSSSERIRYFVSLPRLQTQVKDGNVYVMVPKTVSS